MASSEVFPKFLEKKREKNKKLSRRISRKPICKCCIELTTCQKPGETVKMLPRKTSWGKKAVSVSSKRKRQSLKMPSSKKNLEMTSKNLENKTKQVHKQSAFCKVCKRSFSSEKKLNDHSTKHHLLRHCPNCPKTFHNMKNFIYHLQTHLNSRPYQCEICSHCFNEKKDILHHKKNHEQPKELFECKVCGKLLYNFPAHSQHILVHHGPPYDCDICNARFSNARDRTVHIKNHVYRCNMCPRKVVLFPTNIDCVKHMYDNHASESHDDDDEEEYVKCVSTGAVNLEDDSCSDSMDDLRSLSSSDETDSNMNNIFSSSGDEFDSDMDNNDNIDAVESVFDIKRKNAFICFICYDLYPTQELLKFHLKAHRWYPCNLCPIFFDNAEALKIHVCKNFKMNETTVDIEEVNTNSPKSITPIFPRSIVSVNKTTNVSYDKTNKRLENFMAHAKGQLDANKTKYIDYYTACFRKVLEDDELPNVLNPNLISDLKDMYSKYLKRSQLLGKGSEKS